MEEGGLEDKNIWAQEIHNVRIGRNETDGPCDPESQRYE